MLKEVIVCDECGKEQVKDTDGRTGRGWFRIDRILLYFRPKEVSGSIQNANRAYFDDNKDPDFCSEKCVMSWFKKQLIKAKEGKGK